MNNNRPLLIFLSVLLIAILGGIYWALGLPGTELGYTQATTPPPIVQAERKADSERMQAVLDCIPKDLTEQNRDVNKRWNQVITEMQNDQLERALQLTDSPKLSPSEQQFRDCLAEKGITRD
ncbi:hypothetical protein PN462_06055 [Spirulina sp. CS-785/01]|uniref:hypothetical protein n=1 Tax=Spirulina sp. CS-785/01 TaxID=3021716 RepID=UPI00232B16D7|nr:hypothetical protein [Spirulina sp. CS-785/01]MDB9312658.1 hypothetical protein [Spirulina sp. CS-785/01]